MTMTIESNNRSNRNGKSAQDLVAANIQFLIEQLEAGHSEVLTHYLNAMARFHHYSFGNVLLIARQKPDASHVAGIRTWNSLGRFVRRGEKGIFILAPMIGRKRSEQPEPSGEGEDAKTQLIGFRGVYVFDVAQTEGKELPTVEAAKGDPGSYLAKLVNFTIAQGITFGYSEKIAPAKGVSYGGKIQLLPDMSEGEQFSTLVWIRYRKGSFRGDGHCNRAHGGCRTHARVLRQRGPSTRAGLEVSCPGHFGCCYWNLSRAACAGQDA